MGNCFKKEPSSSYRVTQPPPSSFSGTRNGTGSGDPDNSELRSVFRQFDVNNDGTIDENELRSVMRNMGQNPTDEEIRAMFKAADANGDGQITFDEFITIAKANPMTLSLKTVFAELDDDGDGELTRMELQQAFARMGHKMTEKEVEIIFRQADTNKDGKINFEEFVQMMCQRK